MTILQAVERFHQHIAALVAAGFTQQTTLDGHRFQLSKLRRANGDVLCEAITQDQVYAISNTRNFLQVVQQLYSWLHRNRLINVNPIGVLRKPPVGMRERVADRHEQAAILRAADRRFRLFLVIQRHTIMRPGELRQLRWRDVDLERRVIRLRSFKAKERRRDRLRERCVPLDRYAVRILSAMRRNRQPAKDDPVFPNRRGCQLTCTAVRIAFRRACKRAGISESEERLVCYSIRHTAATEATRTGMPDRVLADIMGHTTVLTTARYQHLDATDLIEAIDRSRIRRVA